MELQKMIIHELNKETQSNVVNSQLSDELIPINQESIALATALADTYRTDRILYAIFDDAVGRYFPEKFYEYRESGRSDADFINFTRSVIGNLEAIIRPITFATGGYFVFAEYTSAGQLFNAIFLIRDVEGKILSRTAHSFSIETVEYVDTKNLAMACRINETKIVAEESNYLSFTQLRQQMVSDYFKNWISIRQLESSSDYTKALYNIISSIDPPHDRDSGEQYSAPVFRGLVYDYVSSNPAKTVNLRELSQHFYDSPDTITNFAEENNISIDTEFRYNNRQLKRFIKLEINRDGINLKVSRGTLEEKIRLSGEDPNLVIIESGSFANAVRRELNSANE